MKNCLYWLNTISDPDIKAKALANYNDVACVGKGSVSPADDNEPMYSLYDALEESFMWQLAPEGPYFWINYQSTLQS